MHPCSLVKWDSPIDVAYVPFAQYSHFAASIDKNNNKLAKQEKILLIGGYKIDKDVYFYEFVVDKNRNSINCKSFENDYKKKFSNVHYLGLRRASYTHSYLVQNNKYLVVFREHRVYNVYDMENDKWLLGLGEKRLRHGMGDGSRSVLINDEIIIVSRAKCHELCFYFIGKNHMLDPILIHEYTLKTEDVSFKYHGMCIIDFRIVQQESSDSQDRNKLYHDQQTYKLKIILFGGIRNQDFLSSFLYLDILLSYMANDEKFDLISLSIDENLIDKNQIKLMNTNCNVDKIPQNKFFTFGYQCILNYKNEPVIVIIGGQNDTIKRDIHLFNCVTFEFTIKKQVIPFDCKSYPAVNKCGDAKFLIMCDRNYCLLNYDIHYVSSRMERIIWIAFYKNNTNDKCFIKILPKDIILYILYFLGKKPLREMESLKIDI